MSWVALCGEDSPPFKGSPDALATAASSMQTIADKLQGQATLLQSYMNDTGSWTGIAKDACVKTVSSLPGQLHGAHDKYQAAASSLAPYASTLREAQAKAQILRGQAEDEQWKINHYSDALKTQRRAEHDEKARADRATTDPTLGDPHPRPWDGPNNAALLQTAKDHLALLRAQLNDLRATVHTAVVNATNGINNAADIVHDTGGVVGFFQHSATNVQHGAKWLAEKASEHGFDLKAVSETLGKLSGWLSLVALLPIPGAQIFGLVGTAVGLASLAVGLVTVLAGQTSLKSWAVGAALTLVPFAAKGLRAVNLARSSGAAGEVSTVAKNLIAQGKNGSLLKSSTKLLKEAENFKLGVVQNKSLKLLHIKPDLKPLESLAMNNFGTRLLTGSSAANTATKVIAMGKAGPIGHIATGLEIAVKGTKAVQTGNKVVTFINGLTHHGQSQGAN
ncbi:MAG: hypothetical protein JWR83_978 [Aeromicrobium sp.]|nr:hypothetical protein [Aeromicrobium sp.]